MDRLPLILSTLCFLLGFAATLASLRTGRHGLRRFHVAMMAGGFALQTLFLLQRGRTIGHCPLTDLFEVLAFLSWSAALFYFGIGRAFRLSLLGMFTAPLLVLLQTGALLAPIDPPHRLFAPHNPWVQFHAALCVMAYGAFALAGVAGVMYLAQERQLKRRHLGVFFFEMPPIADLATANLRLLWAGILLLSAGLASAASIGMAVAPSVWTWGAVLWGAYLLLSLARRMGPRRTALFSAGAFLLAAAALCLFNHFYQGGGL
ncbi:MAG: cytochrome c biogenesis protein CcsA [Chthoniobacteraceae bacterium]|nr:cytochrome c biogenesis protein CcsA [Chthoniobacteraceae bacterium]